MKKNKTKEIPEKPPYDIFAEIYDSVMDHVNYEQWAQKILSEYHKYKKTNPHNILDLACGTGRLLAKMKRKHPLGKYFGLDISPSMINIAKIHCNNMEFSVSKMQNTSYSENKFDLIVCTHDSINYIMEEKELEAFFKEVYRILKKDAVFIVDFTSEENILKNFHNQTFKLHKRNYKMKWSNTYVSKKHLLNSYLEFIDLKTGNEYIETHYQRFYPESKIEKLAKKSGLTLLDKCTNYEDFYLTKNSDLIVLILQK